MQPLKLMVTASFVLACGFANGQDVESGRQLYEDFLCYACHGYNGTSPRRPIANDVSGVMATEQLFITFLRLRADLDPDTASSSMPNYAESALSDAQARDLYVYIKSMKDDPPTVSDNPVMQEILDAAKARRPKVE